MSRKMKPPVRNGSKRYAIALASSISITCIALAWFWTRPKVKLDQDGYKIAIALYRVCNQQHIAGLHSIETQLSESIEQDDKITLQQRELASIVALAHAGDWQTAMVDCRSLLEQQVEH